MYNENLKSVPVDDSNLPASDPNLFAGSEALESGS